MGATFGMCDHGHVTAAFDPVAGLLDQMRRTMYGSVTRLTQGPCHFHRFGHSGRPVVNAGQQMTMPVCQSRPPLSSLFIEKPVPPRFSPLRRLFLLPIISIPI